MSIASSERGADATGSPADFMKPLIHLLPLRSSHAGQSATDNMTHILQIGVVWKSPCQRFPGPECLYGTHRTQSIVVMAVVGRLVALLETLPSQFTDT